MNKLLYTRYLAIIGNQAIMIPMGGDAEEISCGKMDMNAYLAMHGSSDVISISCNDQNIRTWPTDPMSSSSQINDYLDAVMKLVRTTPMSADEEEYSDGECIGHLLRVKTFGGNNNSYSDAECIARIYKFAYMPGDDIEISSSSSVHMRKLYILPIDAANVNINNSIANVNMHASHIIYIYNSIAQTDSYVNANIYGFCAEPISGMSLDESDTEALARLFCVTQMFGANHNYSYAIAHSDRMPVMTGANGYANTYSYNITQMSLKNGNRLFGLSRNALNVSDQINALEALVNSGNCDIKTKSVGGLRLWYLPIQNDTNLNVRQTNAVTLTNGVLEVI